MSNVRGTTEQHGYIMLALLLIMVIGGSSLVLAGLNNRQSFYLRQQQELLYQMEQAKQALLSYAANSANFYGNLRGPGYFPCPDTSTPSSSDLNVVTDSYDSTCSSFLGRLPEAVDVGGKRISINREYEGTDQQFWYAVGQRYTNTSPNNYNGTRQSYRRTTTSASDTNGYNFQLKLDGSQTPRYVAFIIAPGTEIGSQDRASGLTSYSNYLENGNGESLYDFFTANPDPTLSNDQILGITVDDYVRAVGPVVINAISRELDEESIPTYPASQSNFRSIFNYDSNHEDDMPIWLRRNSNSYPGSNGELWVNYVNYSRISSATARITFRGCTGIAFIIDQIEGVSRSGDSC